MNKYLFGKILRSAIMAIVAGTVVLTMPSCGGNKENNEPEPVKESVEFTQTTVSIPIDGNGAVSLKVTPIDKLADVEVNVADEDVIDLDRTSKSVGYRLCLYNESQEPRLDHNRRCPWIQRRKVRRQR